MYNPHNKKLHVMAVLIANIIFFINRYKDKDHLKQKKVVETYNKLENGITF